MEDLKKDTNKLDKLMNFAGQLITSKAKYQQWIKSFDMLVEENKSKSFFESSRREIIDLTNFLGKISSDIQSSIMQMRMVPVKGIFSNTKEKIDQFSTQYNKKINLIVEGEDTELDKKIFDGLDNIISQLIEIILSQYETNSNSDLMISLKAFQKGSIINVEIFDKGFSKEYIKGSIQNINKQIQAINGSFDIFENEDNGKKCVISLPISLSIYQVLLIQIGQQKYALPIESVVEIIKIETKDIYTIDGNDTIKLRGHALSLIDLQKIIKLEGDSLVKKDTAKKAVVITDGHKQVGIFVDFLIGEDNVVTKPLDEFFAKVKGISGGFILGDGNVNLILDPSEIINVVEGKIAV